MKFHLLLLAILPLLTSCEKNEQEMLDIENVDYDNATPKNIYKKYNILNEDTVNVDSLKVYGKEVVIGSYKRSDFDRFQGESRFYPDFLYYSQTIGPDEYITEEEIKEKGIIGVNLDPEIAFFKNIKFSYIDFIVDNERNKMVGCLFSTRNYAKTNYYEDNVAVIKKYLGNPKNTYRGFSNDDGGPVHMPLKFDVWNIKGKMWQFSQGFVEHGDTDLTSISLLILDEELIDTFDSSFNFRFTILKNYFEKDRAGRFQTENILNERIEAKDLSEAQERARKIIRSITSKEQ